MALKRYHLGTTIWSHDEWKGTFFTDDASKDDYLSQYSSVFNSVEGNTTFYGMPTTVAKWGRQSHDDFKFCFKFPQLITHHKVLRDCRNDVKKFLGLMEPLKPKLGPFLIQFSASFGPSQLDILEQFLDELSVEFRYAVEVRHPNFFNHSSSERRLNNLLKSYGVSRVIFDTRKLHASKSAETSVVEAKQKKPKVPVRFEAISARPVVRFVGVNDAVSNEAYLKEWAIITADWIKEGKHPYFFAHAPNQYYGPWVARRFHEILSGLIKINPLPTFPAARQNEQLGLF